MYTSDGLLAPQIRTNWFKFIVCIIIQDDTTQILGVYQDQMIWANVIWLQLVSTENFHNFWFLMFPGLSHCATLPNAHVYHQKPLFVPSRRKDKYVTALQLIPWVSDASSTLHCCHDGSVNISFLTGLVVLPKDLSCKVFLCTIWIEYN